MTPYVWIIFLNISFQNKIAFVLKIIQGKQISKLLYPLWSSGQSS
jgi:hypothetical protein